MTNGDQVTKLWDVVRAQATYITSMRNLIDNINLRVTVIEEHIGVVELDATFERMKKEEADATPTA